MSIKDQFAALIDVKSIVTFAVTGVLVYLSVTGKLTPDQYMIVATMVFTYFFTKTKTADASTTSTTTETPPEG